MRWTRRRLARRDRRAGDEPLSDHRACGREMLLRRLRRSLSSGRVLRGPVGLPTLRATGCFGAISGHHRAQAPLLKCANKTRSLQRLGLCSASSVDVGGSIPSPPTTAGPRHARVSNIWSPAGRSTTCICSDSPHHQGWHICPRNLRLDPHIAARLSLLLPVS
jgi:hypothetical protein